MELSQLGSRICIMGPSNAGKSTLADAIARKLDAPVIHLDVLHHVPGTDWKPRDAEDFERLHDSAILGSRWVMDGNYSKLLPQRLARATGLILLDISAPLSLFRYLRRSWFQPVRIGALPGGRDSVKWIMLKHIAVVSPRNRRRYAELLPTLHLPTVSLSSARQIAACYTAWELQL
ncbi:MAG: AAA family ATPase [Janthinobacterium lividum]